MPADFPVPFNDRLVSLSPGAGTTALNFDFPIYENTGISVIRIRSGTVTTLTLTTHYTVAINADQEASPGGTVTLLTASIASDQYILVGATTIERTSDFAQRGPWNAEDINEQFDRIILMLQEMKRVGLAWDVQTTATIGAVPYDIAANQFIRRNSGNTDWEAVTVATSGTTVVSANETTEGIIEVATDAEAQALTLTNRAIVPGNLGWVLGLMRGHLAGLTLSNNVGDATNDIDIAVGAAVASDQSEMMILSSALTKQLDAAWAVGTNQGGLDTGAIANTTYHVWLIRRPDTGVVDVLFSASATAPTMPTNYTQKRRIGSIIRSGGAIVAFEQIGDFFRRTSAALDRNNTAAAASALLTLSVPVGIVVFPVLSHSLNAGVSVDCNVQIGPAGAGSANVSIARTLTGAGDTSDFVYGQPPPIYATNTSAQLYFAQTNTTGTPTASILATLGWIDRRGRDD